MYTCTYVYIHVYVCIHICVYIYIYDDDDDDDDYHYVLSSLRLTLDLTVFAGALAHRLHVRVVCPIPGIVNYPVLDILYSATSASLIIST